MAKSGVAGVLEGTDGFELAGWTVFIRVAPPCAHGADQADDVEIPKNLAAGVATSR